MSLPIPTNPQQMQQRSLADLQRYLPTTANPFLPESWMGAQAIANANRVFESYKIMRILESEAVPYTAVDTLEGWAAFWGIARNPATGSVGRIIFTGTVGSVIPSASLIASSAGDTFITGSDCTISANAVSVSITRSGSVATATFNSAQDIYDGQTIVISGAVETQYNGSFVVTLIDESTFSYTVTGSPASPATGSPLATYTSASTALSSQETGNDQNLAQSERVYLSTPVSGVDNAAFIAPNGMAGGSDDETDNALRSRLLYRVQNPVAMFNVAQITNTALAVSGVTNVFVEENTPDVGQVTIYFIRANDVSIIPNAVQVEQVRAALEVIRPATTDSANMIVSAPTPVTCNFSMSGVVPYTASMRAAINASLQALFIDYAYVSEPLTEDQYRSAIVNTIDTTTGEQLQSFNLATTGDFGGSPGQYPVLGTVTIGV